MQFEWDEAKAAANLAKHGVPFDFATLVFTASDLDVVEDARHAYGEARHVAMGTVGRRLYVVVFTMRGGTTRIISARKANERERRTHYSI